MRWLILATGGMNACLALWLSTVAEAQSTAAWPIAPERLTLNLGPDNRERRVMFDKDGIAIELYVRVLMVGRDQVLIDAKLPEVGNFQITLARQADIKLARNEAAAGGAQYKLIAQFKISGPRRLRTALRPRSMNC